MRGWGYLALRFDDLGSFNREVLAVLIVDPKELDVLGEHLTVLLIVEVMVNQSFIDQLGIPFTASKNVLLKIKICSMLRNSLLISSTLSNCSLLI